MKSMNEMFGREAADLVEDGSPAERLYFFFCARPVCSKITGRTARHDTTRQDTTRPPREHDEDLPFLSRRKWASHRSIETVFDQLAFGKSAKMGEILSNADSDRRLGSFAHPFHGL